MDPRSGSGRSHQALTLSSINEDVLVNVTKHIGHQGRLSARQATGMLCAAASHHTTTLATEDCTLPARAWRVFPSARHLLIRKSNQHTHRASTKKPVVQMLKDIPTSLESITADYGSLSDEDAQELVNAVTSTERIKASLKRVDILHNVIFPTAAETLINNLQKLQIIDITIAASPRTTNPTAPKPLNLQPPPSLTSCNLSARGRRNQLFPALDIDSLAAAKGLTQLHVNGLHITNADSISKLTALQDLSLYMSEPAQLLGNSRQLQSLHVISSLTHLQKLDASFINCSADGWRVLASLPELSTASLGSITITRDATAKRLQTLTCEDLWMQTLVGDADDAPRGCLASILPELSNIKISAAHDPLKLVMMLQGHTRVSSLTIQSSSDIAQDWQHQDDAPLLSSMPNISNLKLQCLVLSDGRSFAALTQGCAQLKSLEELEIDWTTDGASWDDLRSGLQALSEGVCAGSIKHLVLMNVGGFAGGDKLMIREAMHLLQRILSQDDGDGGNVVVDVAVPADVMQPLVEAFNCPDDDDDAQSDDGAGGDDEDASVVFVNDECGRVDSKIYGAQRSVAAAVVRDVVAAGFEPDACSFSGFRGVEGVCRVVVGFMMPMQGRVCSLNASA